MLPENIVITENPTHRLSSFLGQKNYSKVFVLTDEHTADLCLPIVSDALPAHTLFTVKSGEEHKTLTTCTAIWQAMTDANLDRHAVVIVLGGGVLGDMGGFCAATYKRGLDFILIPTTLLAQADASIGGKLGIDFNNFKNHIGVFQQPVFTLLSAGFLKTLPEAELRSGFAEVIKHALISDKAMWDTIRSGDLNAQDWNALLQHSAEFKYSVIQEDPREKGLRKILNAGHTIGHALETFFLSNGNKVMHGEAIAAGLMAEGYIAAKKALLSQEELEQITTYIKSVFGKLPVTDDTLKEIALLALQDKKNKGNSILSALPDGIGKATWNVEISLSEIAEALTFYQSV